MQDMAASPDVSLNGVGVPIHATNASPADNRACLWGRRGSGGYGEAGRPAGTEAGSRRGEAGAVRSYAPRAWQADIGVHEKGQVGQRMLMKEHIFGRGLQ